jgi:hypothetical protein
MPTSREFVIASFLLYYDFGILLQVLLGIQPERNLYGFRSLFDSPDETQAISVILLLISPWIIDYAAGSIESRAKPIEARKVCILPARRLMFYIGVSLLCLLCATLAIKLAVSSDFIWAARVAASNLLGPYIVILFVPLSILVFYVQIRDSHSAFGRFYVGFLVLCSVISALPAGERTYLLLPFVSIFLFWGNLSLRRIAIAGAAVILGASLLLPFFKAKQEHNDSTSDMLLSTLNGDLSRSPILADVVTHSSLVGTRLLDYPGAGYVYSALMYVPRSIVPFKGYATAIAYTAYVDNTVPGETNWGLGISAIDELLLNFGILLVPFGLAFYGYAIGFADKLSQRDPTLVAPTRLATVFILAYHLPAIILVYGSMALTAIVLRRLFAVIEPTIPIRTHLE